MALGLALLALAVLAGEAGAAPGQGVWLTADQSVKIAFGPCPLYRERLCGAVAWMKSPLDAAGSPRRDLGNPDPALRQRPLQGLTLVWDLKPAGDGRWTDGRLYDPRSGRTVEARARLSADGAMRIEGCVGPICKAQLWTRTN
nr:DUF2147 domain-containing protein [Caulobacter hibisci]